MRPEARSLNLASAAAVGIYEAVRQIEGKARPAAKVDIGCRQNQP
jgi:hypothetical protein